ncbi:PD-(D/E)XK motif protein [Paenibacillus swuensis]|nr:PD-(D/E)XK motif protein [Paenibacillus swuensis]
MMDTEEIKKKWESISDKSGYIRVDATHKMEWYLGYQDPYNKSLLLISNRQPTNIRSSESIEVTCRLRFDNKWTILFNLTNPKHEEVYELLCIDLIEYSRNINSNQDGLEKVLYRYKQWLNLLKATPSGIMDGSKLKGLFGELLYLDKQINNINGALESIQAWMGPEGADQDFFYSTGWAEVKATTVSSNQVSISSIEQLDNLLPGKLIVYRIDETAPNAKDALTINHLVQNILNKLCLDSSDTFKDKLLKAGYVYNPGYNAIWYKFNNIPDEYDVVNGFPKITRASLPVHITEASYKLDLASIKAWKVVH